MSLFTLLNLGSAMPKVKAMGRYNLAKQTALPTFGPNKKTQPIGERSAEIKPPAANLPMPAKVESQPISPKKPAAEKAAPSLGWLKKSNPFAAPSTAAAQPAPVKSDKPVQAELSLDKVKVVRNDLSDADIEIIPKAAKVPKAPPGTTIPAKRYMRPEVQPDQLGKKAWSLLGSRLFGAAATKH